MRTHKRNDHKSRISKITILTPKKQKNQNWQHFFLNVCHKSHFCKFQKMIHLCFYATIMFWFLMSQSAKNLGGSASTFLWGRVLQFHSNLCTTKYFHFEFFVSFSRNMYWKMVSNLKVYLFTISRKFLKKYLKTGPLKLPVFSGHTVFESILTDQSKLRLLSEICTQLCAKRSTEMLKKCLFFSRKYRMRFYQFFHHPLQMGYTKWLSVISRIIQYERNYMQSLKTILSKFPCLPFKVKRSYWKR